MYQSVLQTGTVQKSRLINPFKPLPWQLAPWKDKSPIMLLTGGAGAGRSRLAAEKIHGYCLHYPGSTALVTRKVKTSMSSGTILFYRRKVIGNDPQVRWVDSPKNRFEYRNGSILQFIGMLDGEARENLKSIGQDGAVDIVDMVEATQFDEEDLNALAARMRGKAAPWQQIILECNPDAPTHWIKRRLIDGMEASVYHASAIDNPHNPATYHEWLQRLTGIDYDRLVLGKWVQATGLVYDVWADPGNVTEEAEYIPEGGPIYWACDDGYAGSRDEKTGYFTADSHPRVFLLIQERANGQLCVFYEDYRIKTEADPHIAEVLCAPMKLADVRNQFAIPSTTTGRELIDAIRSAREKAPALFYLEPDYVAADSAAATLNGMLINRGFYIRKKPPSVEESIKTHRRMIAPDENGFRRWIVHPRCKHLRMEYVSYRRDPQTGKVVDAFDHGPSAGRYFTWTKRLED